MSRVIYPHPYSIWNFEMIPLEQIGALPPDSAKCVIIFNKFKNIYWSGYNNITARQLTIATMHSAEHHAVKNPNKLHCYTKQPLLHHVTWTH